jgi:hypothetical protein
MLTFTAITDEEGGIESTALSLALVLLHLYAMFLSFQRNKGFSFGPFLMAALFPEPYIAYAYAVKA